MASMVLADCSVARLGPFGAQSSMALNSPSLQRLIPQLFQLLNTQIGQRCQELPVWPAQYRLDALADQGKVNLAYLVLGQGLELGWVEWVRSEEHTSELQSRGQLVCRLLLEKKKRGTRTR